MKTLEAKRREWIKDFGSEAGFQQYQQSAFDADKRTMKRFECNCYWKSPETCKACKKEIGF